MKSKYKVNILKLINKNKTNRDKTLIPFQKLTCRVKIIFGLYFLESI